MIKTPCAGPRVSAKLGIRSRVDLARLGSGFRAASSARDPGTVPEHLPDLTMCGADQAATLGTRAIGGPTSGRREG